MYAPASSHYTLMIIEFRCRIVQLSQLGLQETHDSQGEHSIRHMKLQAETHLRSGIDSTSIGLTTPDAMTRPVLARAM